MLPSVLRPVGGGEPVMDSYRCNLCGYVYNPAIGDSAHGVEPNTAFEDLPVNWRCPRCGAAKSRFVKV